MESIQVFLDADVVIAALLSKTGASAAILRNSTVKKLISPTIEREVLDVSKRLRIKHHDVKMTLRTCAVRAFDLKRHEVLDHYAPFVFDHEDAHVVAGAHRTSAPFLLTHNLRHFRANTIHQKLGVIVVNPGHFLQYLRSLGKF